MSSDMECQECGFFEVETGDDCPVCGRKLKPAVETWFVDGSGWNGRFSRFCVVYPSGLIHTVMGPSESTNNEMEYAAVIYALERAQDRAFIYTDSSLVVGHLTKGWKINAMHLQSLYDKAMWWMDRKNCRVMWVPRELNLAGIHLDKLKRRRV